MPTDDRFRNLARLEEDLRSLSPVEIDQFNEQQRRFFVALGQTEQAAYLEGGLNPPRVCPRCAQVKLLDEFKRRSQKQGGGPSWCKACINRQSAERRRKRRNAAVGRLGKSLRLSSPASRTEAVLAAFAQKIGGCEAAGKALADHWHDGIQSHDRRAKLTTLNLVFRILTTLSERN